MNGFGSALTDRADLVVAGVDDDLARGALRAGRREDRGALEPDRVGLDGVAAGAGAIAERPLHLRAGPARRSSRSPSAPARRPRQRAPSFCVTLKITGLFGTGLPAASVSATTSGAGSAEPIAAVWLLPEIELDLRLASSACRDDGDLRRRRVADPVPCRPPESRSRPSASGTVVREERPVRHLRRRRRSPSPAPARSFTVPTTMSLTLPATEIEASVVTN